MTMKLIVKLSMAVALCAVAGVAAADNGDSSMNPYTGDSWAALQGHGHNLGERKTEVSVRIAKPAGAEPSAATPAVAQAPRGFDFGHHRRVAASGEAAPV
jgi:hypothetical protein